MKADKCVEVLLFKERVKFFPWRLEFAGRFGGNFDSKESAISAWKHFTKDLNIRKYKIIP